MIKHPHSSSKSTRKGSLLKDKMIFHELAVPYRLRVDKKINYETDEELNEVIKRVGTN